MALSNNFLAIVLVIGLSMANICCATSLTSKLKYIVPHNMARAIEHLPPVTWNDTLAAFAKAYARERAVDCALQHSGSPVYGENIAMSTGDLSPSLAIKLWVGEKPDYDYELNTCTEGKMCGHYTQVIWKNTKSIGCASARCQNGGTFITCNYYPPGNYIGQRPF
ncbi:pathogenesis-related protein PR-1 type-like [Silene latifolia]|uniref:pathogenesis-related protein PR-1 type-like n=1 Tax=Silene latifolia TaxID=37657 RepID=UPI003D76C860